MGFINSSSDRSPSTSPSRRTYPSLAFPGAMSVLFKSPALPPSTTTSPDSSISPLSLTSTNSSDSCILPATPPVSVSSGSFASTAFPDWPKRDILTPLSSFCGKQASSYISDDDLLDLEHLELYDGVRIPTEKTAGISWEATVQPPVVMVASEPAKPKSKPITKRRRRSSPLNKKKLVAGMSPIAEAPE